jgi:hypothetical protein
MILELQIPDEVAELLAEVYEDLPRAVRVVLAVEQYRSKRFSGCVRRQQLIY